MTNIIDMTDEEVKSIFFVDNSLNLSYSNSKPVGFTTSYCTVYRTPSIGNICIQREVDRNGDICLSAISDADDCHHKTSNQYSIDSETYIQDLIDTAKRLAFYIKLGKPKLN